MSDSPNSEAPRRARRHALTTEQLEEARNRYVRNGEDEREIAAVLGVPRSVVTLAKRTAKDWDELRVSWRASGKAANDRLAASEADTKAAVNRFQARVSQTLLDLLEAKARVIADADEKDPETARRTMRALGSIKAIAEVQRLSHDMVTSREGSEVNPLLTKLIEIMQGPDDTDGQADSPGAATDAARAPGEDTGRPQ